MSTSADGSAPVLPTSDSPAAPSPEAPSPAPTDASSSAGGGERLGYTLWAVLRRDLQNPFAPDEADAEALDAVVASLAADGVVVRPEGTPVGAALREQTAALDHARSEVDRGRQQNDDQQELEHAPNVSPGWSDGIFEPRRSGQWPAALLPGGPVLDLTGLLEGLDRLLDRQQNRGLE